MKVQGNNIIKGRGIVTTVDIIPARLREGMSVQSVERKDRQWRVTRIDVAAKFQHKRDRDMHGGLLLQGNSPLPEVGDELEIAT